MGRRYRWPKWIKIGKTRDLSNRLATYNTGAPYNEVRYELTYFAPSNGPHPNALTIEQSIHQHLLPITSDIASSEWYEMSVEEGKEIIDRFILKHQ